MGKKANREYSVCQNMVKHNLTKPCKNREQEVMYGVLLKMIYSDLVFLFHS
jgi:hypothetical protein